MRRSFEKFCNRSAFEKFYYFIYRNAYRFNPWYIIKQIKYFCQRRIRGFSDDQLWCLDCTIIRFILPRLKRFRDLGPPNSFPQECSSPEEWEEILGKMIIALEIANDGGYPLLYPKDCTIAEERVQAFQEGWELFHKYFFSLWD